MFNKLTATTLFLASILVATQAATLEKRTNHCGGSSFENRWRATAPLVSDCQTLANNIRGDGDWTQTTASGQRQIASFGTCHFGVEGNNSDGFYRVGNEDVMDLIHDSISKFQKNGRVAARGTMPCDNIAGGQISILWGIYE
ncbi:putative necrosis-inducing factor-domain-containing protein [Panaeolus papilionaceus]|nr:putative necrosis-inducing factor-domain-containing protein [Panaeolus papilionaceus]